MSNETPPPRRPSAELTLVIPRDQLPPPSRQDLTALDLDPENPETRELFARCVRVSEDDDPKERPTLVPCPAGCKTCSCCSGMGMVTSDEAAAWRIQQADQKSDCPDDVA